eukprot:8603442-Ditylum_brightwellii.AAC.1
MKGNFVAMEAAGRALQYATEKDSGIACVPSEPSKQYERNEDASVEAMQVSSTEAATPIPVPSPKQRRQFAHANKSLVASPELFWHQHVNVANEVMLMYSCTETKGKVTSVPQP